MKKIFAVIVISLLSLNVYALDKASLNRAKINIKVAEEMFNRGQHKAALAKVKEAKSLIGNEVTAQMVNLEMKLLTKLAYYPEAKQQLDLLYAKDNISDEMIKDIAVYEPLILAGLEAQRKKEAAEKEAKYIASMQDKIDKAKREVNQALKQSAENHKNPPISLEQEIVLAPGDNWVRPSKNMNTFVVQHYHEGQTQLITYRKSSSGWKPLAEKIDIEGYSNVSLSDDGRMLAYSEFVNGKGITVQIVRLSAQGWQPYGTSIVINEAYSEIKNIQLAARNDDIQVGLYKKAIGGKEDFHNYYQHYRKLNGGEWVQIGKDIAVSVFTRVQLTPSGYGVFLANPLAKQYRGVIMPPMEYTGSKWVGNPNAKPYIGSNVGAKAGYNFEATGLRTVFSQAFQLDRGTKLLHPTIKKLTFVDKQWKARTIATLPGFENYKTIPFDVSSDTKRIAYRLEDDIHILNANANGQYIASTKTLHETDMRQFAMSTDGKRLVVTTKTNNRLRIYRIGAEQSFSSPSSAIFF